MIKKKLYQNDSALIKEYFDDLKKLLNFAQNVSFYGRLGVGYWGDTNYSSEFIFFTFLRSPPVGMLCFWMVDQIEDFYQTFPSGLALENFFYPC